MDNIRLVNFKDDRESFYHVLRLELLKVFNVADVQSLPENYGISKEWSLLRMIIDNQLDSYQLIYENNKFWSGSGGILRDFDGSRIYQAGFRAFADAKSLYAGIGCKSYSHEYNTKLQIERAKELGCESLVLSFNIENERLFEITYKYHLKKVFGKDIFVASQEPVMFNGVPQWLLTMSLK
jgi:hypothetical protein